MGDGGITWNSSGGWVTDALSAFFGTTATSGVDENGTWVIKIGNSQPIDLAIIFRQADPQSIKSNCKSSGNSLNIVCLVDDM